MIGYLRVSKAREEMISPDIQRKAITRWAKENNRRIVGWMEDLDRSGREFAKRKIREGITRIEAGEAVEIGVYRYDRWGRNAADSLANCARVEKVGGQVRSATEPFDVETAIGKYSRTNAFALAEMQSDIISENWQAALEDRAERGLPVTGGPRFGYTCTPRARGGDGLYRPDPLTGPALVACYRRYVEGHGWRALCEHLNNAGHRTRAGGPWDSTTLRAVMDSGFAAGLLIHNNGTDPDGPVHHTAGAHEALLDPQLWEAYRRRRREMATRYPAQVNATYRLTGLLVCGDCGASMAHQPNNRTGSVEVRCSRWARTRTGTSNYHPLVAVEGAVLTWLGEHGDERRDAELRRQVAVLARASRVEADVKSLEAEAKALDRQILKLVEGWSAGIVPQKAYDTLHPKLHERAEQIVRALDVAEAPAPAVSSEDIASLVSAWESLGPKWANEALRKLITAIIVTKGQIVVLGRWETL